MQRGGQEYYWLRDLVQVDYRQRSEELDQQVAQAEEDEQAEREETSGRMSMDELETDVTIQPELKPYLRQV